MKITKSKLKQIIREEISAGLSQRDVLAEYSASDVGMTQEVGAKWLNKLHSALDQAGFSDFEVTLIGLTARALAAGAGSSPLKPADLQNLHKAMVKGSASPYAYEG